MGINHAYPRTLECKPSRCRQSPNSLFLSCNRGHLPNVTLTFEHVSLPHDLTFTFSEKTDGVGWTIQERRVDIHFTLVSLDVFSPPYVPFPPTPLPETRISPRRKRTRAPATRPKTSARPDFHGVPPVQPERRAPPFPREELPSAARVAPGPRRVGPVDERGA